MDPARSAAPEAMSGGATATDQVVAFQCNICGAPCTSQLSGLEREARTCNACGSTVRWRAVVYLLSLELLGRGVPLPEFPENPNVRGVGLSDWEGYAIPLAEKLGYTNTFYHQEPYPNITADAPLLEGVNDFVIASDVFEHLPPPVDVAFRNVAKLLKSDGFIVFTAPYGLDAETIEYFPELWKYDLSERGGSSVLRNVTRDGRVQEFTDLVFHGGGGSTLEMRIFSEEAIIRELRGAGFGNVQVLRDAVPEYGIYWKFPFSLPITARKQGGPDGVQHVVAPQSQAPAVRLSGDPVANPRQTISPISRLDIAAMRERGLAFSAELEQKKATLDVDFDWYPYSTLNNLVVLDQLLTGDRRRFGELIREGPVLDIGTADGDLAFFLDTLGVSVHAIDHAPTNFNGLQAARRLKDELSSSVEIYDTDLDAQWELPEEHYRFVFFLGTLYHLKNPYYALELLARAVDYCALSTRVARFSPAKDVDFSHQPIAYLLDAYEANNDPTNFWIFSEFGLRRLISRTGWEIEDYQTFGNTVSSDPASSEGDERVFCLLRSRRALSSDHGLGDSGLDSG
jgi:tRNA (mo5U34)-methyltransferase